jgi:hypothetical protein
MCSLVKLYWNMLHVTFSSTLPSEQYILYEWALPVRCLVSLFGFEYKINFHFSFFSELYSQMDLMQ